MGTIIEPNRKHIRISFDHIITKSGLVTMSCENWNILQRQRHDAKNDPAWSMLTKYIHQLSTISERYDDILVMNMDNMPPLYPV